jgi:hypothetical protein
MADPAGFVSDYSDEDESQLVTRQSDDTPLLKETRNGESASKVTSQHSLEMNKFVNTLEKVAEDLSKLSLEAPADSRNHPCHANAAVGNALIAARHAATHNDTEMMEHLQELTQDACYEMKRLGGDWVTHTATVRRALESVTV